ncbi:MAG: Na+/H+ antiporter NhaA [Campylobacter sputorum]|uniref:Na+/H+ antiporter NhaA n=1 Tax=Campylobacter sputorum TaxID=206 RepID=UPI000B76DA6F|nr:Na+/H+ antiporter NhaA [Campylobacter sputorum]ASM38652.1 Na+/H+ antiporter [Campylobacter sputorum bv. paraureolyticus LMG 11764]MDY6120878.1 Na+/H+ antiporter NhaA [Campylobacter sputorum]
MTTFVKKIFKSETTGGVLLLIATILALIFQNSSLTHNFYHFVLEFPVVIGVGDYVLDKPFEFWVNDALMAIFFFSIGLELKREMIEGQLRHFSQVFLPSFAALGGVIFPAIIFSIINWGNEFAMRGWAIPTATDIAFAVGVLAILGKRIPSSLKIFILTLAIMDDLCAIVIIALFYSTSLNFAFLIGALVCTLILISISKKGVNSKGIFILFSIILWICVLNSGVHATIAGVIAGFTIPIYNENNGTSMLKEMEHSLSIPVNFLILPIFAFVNAGINLQGMSLDYLLSPVPLGIFAGLFFGKQFGVFLFSYIVIKLKFATLPQNATWKQLYSIAIICGIGFTMALFVANLAYLPDPLRYHQTDKLAILLASVVSGVVGYIVARVFGNNPDGSPKNHK